MVKKEKVGRIHGRLSPVYWIFLLCKLRFFNVFLDLIKYAEISLKSNKDVRKRDVGIGPSENSSTFAAYHRLLFQLDL